MQAARQAKTNTMNGQRKEKANGVSSMHNQVWRYYNKTGAFVNQKAAHAIINYTSGFALSVAHDPEKQSTMKRVLVSSTHRLLPVFGICAYVFREFTHFLYAGVVQIGHGSKQRAFFLSGYDSTIRDTGREKRKDAHI